MEAMIYDIEIKKAIQGRNETKLAGIEYCGGWNDHAGMGISCIGAFDYATGRTRVFMDDNIGEFAELVKQRDLIVSFNGLSFDNRVCAANGIEVPDAKSYDILVEMWLAAGLGPKFAFPTHMGFGLDATCEANFGTRKTGHGALAPVDFQRGKFGSLVDYCLNDIALTKQVFDQIVASGQLLDPRGSGDLLTLRAPFPAMKEAA